MYSESSIISYDIYRSLQGLAMYIKKMSEVPLYMLVNGTDWKRTSILQKLLLHL